jgi:ABC-2 type transport system ATP-binding protein
MSRSGEPANTLVLLRQNRISYDFRLDAAKQCPIYGLQKQNTGGNAVIEVQHLTKRYGPFTAVDDVSFKVERGEILGFLGPNGAGKTTTMRVLTGYMPPTEGKAVVAGYDVSEQPIEAKRRTGYLPETPPLYPDMTVSEYLLFCARIKGIPRGDRKTRVMTAMERTRVADMAKRHCGKLSKGYRQRVGLAQALLHNPDVLILDEPTAGLDPKQIIETRRLIKELAGDHTIILSTHILPEVSQTCQRVVIINKGRVVAIDTPENLTAKLRGSEAMYVEIDAPGTNAQTVLSGLPGVTQVNETPTRAEHVAFEVQSAQGRDVRRDIAAAVVRQGWGLLELRPMRMSLEEIFLSLTTEDAATAPDASGRARPDAELETSHE